MNVHALGFDTGFFPEGKARTRVEHQVGDYDEELIDFLRKQRISLNITFSVIMHHTSPARVRLPTKRSDYQSTLFQLL